MKSNILGSLALALLAGPMATNAITLNYTAGGNTANFGSGFDTNCGVGNQVAGLFDICHEDLLTADGSATFSIINDTASILLGRITDEDDWVELNEKDDLSMSVSLALADGVSHTFVFSPSVTTGGEFENWVMFSSSLTYGSPFTFTSGGYYWTVASRLVWTASDNAPACTNWDTTGDTSSTNHMASVIYGNSYACYRADFLLTGKELATIPEPGTLALLGLGLLGLGVTRRKAA